MTLMMMKKKEAPIWKIKAVQQKAKQIKRSKVSFHSISFIFSDVFTATIVILCRNACVLQHEILSNRLVFGQFHCDGDTLCTITLSTKRF